MVGDGMVENGRLPRLVMFLTMALRDRPDGFGIRPDRGGFVSLMDLMGVILDEPDFSWVTVKDVEAAVQSGQPPLFEISGTRIRVLGKRGAPAPVDQKRPSGGSRRRRRPKRPEHGSSVSQPAQTREAASRSGGPAEIEATAPAGETGAARGRRRRRRRRKPGGGPPPQAAGG